MTENPYPFDPDHPLDALRDQQMDTLEKAYNLGFDAGVAHARETIADYLWNRQKKSLFATVKTMVIERKDELP